MQVYLAVTPGQLQEAARHCRNLAHVAYRMGEGSTLLRQSLLLQTRGGLLAVTDQEADRKSTRLNSSHSDRSRMPSSA